MLICWDAVTAGLCSRTTLVWRCCSMIAGRSEDWLGDLDLEAIRAAVALSPDAVDEAA